MPTLADVPDGPMLMVFEHLPLAYSGLPQAKRWPITRLELCAGEDSSLLEAQLGASMPSITTLLVSTGEEAIRLDAPALVASLTSCTGLHLEWDGSGGSSPGRIGVAPAVFAALPNLRILRWDSPAFTSSPNSGLTTTPFESLMGHLVSLTLHAFVGEEFFSRLQPHVPNLRHLTLESIEDEAIPSVAFDLASLETLKLRHCKDITRISDGIGRLTRLTRLVCEGCVKLTGLSPAIGSLSRLHSLVLCGCALRDIPAEVEYLAHLTELCILSNGGPSFTIRANISRLHALKVWVRAGTKKTETHGGRPDFEGSSQIRMTKGGDLVDCRGATRSLI